MTYQLLVCVTCSDTQGANIRRIWVGFNWDGVTHPIHTPIDHMSDLKKSIFFILLFKNIL